MATRTSAAGAACPACGSCSGRVHSGHERRITDAAVGGRRVVVRLRVRRFRCDAPTCSRTTFVEQVAGLTCPYGRRSARLHSVLTAVALTLAGRVGRGGARRGGCQRCGARWRARWGARWREWCGA
ncbi:transposase family protein [Streptomyces sp. SID3343]|uniref:transposase family protein n=1 Tax=Streptomyces sp. SID3343 TaxID=2690260 RepID=UPI0031F8783E